MSIEFRQVQVGEAATYHALVSAAYAQTLALGIRFDAATASLEQTTLHLNQHGVYALYDSGTMVATVTLRYPWGSLPGPIGLPHIGWFAADPRCSGKNYGHQVLEHLETEIVSAQLRAPAMTLGTALNHPWLVEMYLKWGYQCLHTADLGKGHITQFMLKVLDVEGFAAYKERHLRH